MIERKAMNATARLIAVADLVDAIHACHADDAKHVLSVTLEKWRCGAPPPPFIDAISDAEFWVSAATFEDLRAIFIASGRRLARYPLGIKECTRMAARMLNGLDPEARHAVLAALSQIANTENAEDAGRP